MFSLGLFNQDEGKLATKAHARYAPMADQYPLTPSLSSVVMMINAPACVVTKKVKKAARGRRSTPLEGQPTMLMFDAAAHNNAASR